MKQNDEMAKNIFGNAKAQEEIRAMRERHVREGKITVESDDARQAREQKGREVQFDIRLRGLQEKTDGDRRTLEHRTSSANQMESWQGYLAYHRNLTVAGNEREPSFDDWNRLRTSRREMTENAQEELYASNHAYETLRWAEGQPEALRTAIEAVRQQLDTARQELDAAAADVQSLWIRSQGSPELRLAQERLAMKSKVIGRLEKSLRLLEKGA